MMSSSDRTGIDNTEVATKEGEDKVKESTEDTSSEVSMLDSISRVGPLRTFGVSSRCEYVPSERINLMYGVSTEQLCENMAFSQTLNAGSDEIPDSDAAEVLHPVFSPMLHSSHKAAWHQTFEDLSEILPEDIGLTNVKVVNHSMQWEDFDKNPDLRSSDTQMRICSK